MTPPTALLEAFERHQVIAFQVLALESTPTPSIAQRHELFDLHAQKTKATGDCLAAWGDYSQQLKRQALEAAGSEREELVELLKKNVQDSAVLSRHQITLFSLVVERSPHRPALDLREAARQLEDVAGGVTAAVQGREGEVFAVKGLTDSLAPLLFEIKKDGMDQKKGYPLVKEAAAVLSMWINKADKTMEYDSVMAHQKLERLGQQHHAEALRQLPVGLQNIIASAEMKAPVASWRAQRHQGISEVLTDRIVRSAPKPRT